MIIFFLFLHCGPKPDEVERVFEDGVEVVVNHVQPYKIKGESGTFIVEKEFVIDLEKNDLADIGLTEIHDYAVDSSGNIYFSDSHSKGNMIFKFDASGDYLQSFCFRGQGPGELPRAPMMMCTQDDELLAYSGRKFLLFRPDGSLVSEAAPGVSYISRAALLDNGNYLMRIIKYSREGAEKTVHMFMLYDSHFNEIKELDRIETFPLVAKRIEGIRYNLVAKVSSGRIFTGSQQRDYEIYVYDFNGNLIKKIRKDYIKVPTSEEYKEGFLGMFKSNPAVYEAAKKKIFFPSVLPPFHYFLPDEKGRLYVMTYERGIDSEEYMFDIFDPEGVFIGRKSLVGFSILEELPLNIRIKNDRFYRIVQMESGYQEFVVSKMMWE